jgi:xanthine dehydrogenase accessory factor
MSMSRPSIQCSRSVPASGPGHAEWLRPLREWPRALLRALERDSAVVRIVVAEIQGSAPREPGVSMLVGSRETEGTIGGGQLEWQVLTAARTLLAAAAPAARLQRMVLGAPLAQCCGGVVEVWMERYTRADRVLLLAADCAARKGAALLMSTLTSAGVARQVVSEPGAGLEQDELLREPREHALPRLTRTARGGVILLERLDEAFPPLWLYGAGHVGQALARIMGELPVRLTWIDSRAELFPAEIPDSIRIMHASDPVQTVAAAPANTRFLVLTHSHPLDYALCRAILERGRFAWMGLIGSKSKGARFRSRLARDGLPAETIARLTCPIGDRSIVSKWPSAIAVGVAAQLLRDLSGAAACKEPPGAQVETTCTASCTGCGSAEQAARRW